MAILNVPKTLCTLFRYATTKLTVQNISDCQYVAAMNPTAGSFQVRMDDPVSAWVLVSASCCFGPNVMGAVDSTTQFFQWTQINPRLQRHFLVFAIGMPSPTSLLAIFETFLEGHLRQEVQGKRFQVGVVQVCASLIKGALSVHKEVGLKQCR